MTRVGNSENSRSWQEGVPVPSPNGRRVALVLRKGDLQTSTNSYSLLVFDAGNGTAQPVSRVLLTFASSSNREAIKQVRWSDDDTIFFLGENRGDSVQVYQVRYGTRKCQKLTDHPTNITSFSISAGGGAIAYAAERPLPSVNIPAVLRDGYFVPAQVNLSELIRGYIRQSTADRYELFLQRRGQRQGRRIGISGRLVLPDTPLFLSPDGKYLVVKSFVRTIQPDWGGYQDPVLEGVIAKTPRNSGVTMIEQYELVNLPAVRTSPLLDAPVGYSGSQLMWSPDSQFVVATNVHLSLNVVDSQERQTRRSSTFVAQIRIPDREVTEITTDRLQLVGYDQKARVWTFREAGNRPPAGDRSVFVYYHQTQAGWIAIDRNDVATETRLKFTVQEGMNEPPRLVTVNAATKQENVVLDLNPQFASLAFGNESEIHWRDAEGHEFQGGLYLPPNYRAGTRYPLVIQTHGFHPDEFWIDGPYSTAFAAQAFAGKGIAVLQLPEYAVGTSEEGERNLSAINSAVQYLDERGVVDPSRVGLIGFSRTSYHVKYALTHSLIHFAAASVADGFDGGYIQYLEFANESPYSAADTESLIGGAPFADGLLTWFEKSPGFRLHEVATPVLIEALGPDSLIGEWEWFSGLARLGRAVDFLYLPAGSHILEKPWERMASQQANVDWFAFWLKGEQDPDPGKSSQYLRWQALRERTVK